MAGKIEMFVEITDKENRDMLIKLTELIEDYGRYIIVPNNNEQNEDFSFLKFDKKNISIIVEECSDYDKLIKDLRNADIILHRANITIHESDKYLLNKAVDKIDNCVPQCKRFLNVYCFENIEGYALDKKYNINSDGLVEFEDDVEMQCM